MGIFYCFSTYSSRFRETQKQHKHQAEIKSHLAKHIFKYDIISERRLPIIQPNWLLVRQVFPFVILFIFWPINIYWEQKNLFVVHFNPHKQNEQRVRERKINRSYAIVDFNTLRFFKVNVVCTCNKIISWLLRFFPFCGPIGMRWESCAMRNSCTKLSAADAEERERKNNKIVRECLECNRKRFSNAQSKLTRSVHFSVRRK